MVNALALAESVQSPKPDVCSSCSHGVMDGTARHRSRLRPGQDRGAGPKPHRFLQTLLLVPTKRTVAIMQRIGNGRRETQTHAADEILRLIPVEHDGVQHAQRLAAGIKVEAQRER